MRELVDHDAGEPDQLLLPAAQLLLKAAKVDKGSGVPNRTKVGTVTKDQVREIAELKMEDLNAIDIEGASKIIEGTARSMGLALTGVAPELERLRPDLVLVLGDRYETFAIAAAASVLRIPVAHIAGGDAYVPRWTQAAQVFRDNARGLGSAKLDLAYGDRPRNRVDLKRSGASLHVPPHQSILEVLEANGHEVPFSCREGLCGTCETRAGWTCAGRR